MKLNTILASMILFSLILVGCRTEQPVAVDTAEAAAGPTFLTEAFQTPESVLYDRFDDVYLVSNINGDPLAEDGNGFISRISASDHSVELRWISGETEGVTLNAPKGMALVGDELWVTDITAVRRFDRRSGNSLGEVAIAGTTFLNDLVAAPDGGAYVSDTGLRAGADGFEPTGTDAIYRISADGAVEQIAAGDALGRPNGLAIDSHGLWVVTFGSGEFYRLEDGQKADVQQLPQGSLDGLVRLEDGSFLISSWDAGAIYRGASSGPFEPIIENLDAPADIGFDTKRYLVLVPHFMENRISIHPLPPRNQ